MVFRKIGPINYSGAPPPPNPFIHFCPADQLRLLHWSRQSPTAAPQITITRISIVAAASWLNYLTWGTIHFRRWVGVHRFRFKNIPRHVFANLPSAPRVNIMANRNVGHFINNKPPAGVG